MSEGGGGIDPSAGKTTAKPSWHRSTVKTIIAIAIVVVAALFVVGFAMAGFTGSLYNYSPTSSNVQTNIPKPADNSAVYTFTIPEVTVNDITRTADHEPTRDQFQIFDMMHQAAYVNKDYNFQMNYPSSTFANEDRTISGMTFIVAFESGTSNEGSYAINVMTQSMGGMTLPDYISAAKDQLEESLSTNNYSLLDSKPAKIRSDYNAYVIDYLFKGDGGVAKVRQVIIPHGDQAYVITFLGVPSTAYDVNLATFNAAVASFKFLG